MASTPHRREVVRAIAEEAETIKMGAVQAGEVTEDYLLWPSEAETPTLALDSLDIFELAFRVESRIGVGFPEDFDIMSSDTVRDLVDHLLKSHPGW